MGMLENVLTALDRWDEWRQMRAAPARRDALEQALGDAISGALDPMNCTACRTGKVEIKNRIWATASFTLMQTTARICGQCGYRDEDTSECRSMTLDEYEAIHGKIGD